MKKKKMMMMMVMISIHCVVQYYVHDLHSAIWFYDHKIEYIQHNNNYHYYTATNTGSCARPCSSRSCRHHVTSQSPKSLRQVRCSRGSFWQQDRGERNASTPDRSFRSRSELRYYTGQPVGRRRRKNNKNNLGLYSVFHHITRWRDNARVF